MPNRILISIFALLCCGILPAQTLGEYPFATNYPQNFRSPVDIPIILAGTFGELRRNHFHAGLDIKTEGVEGKRIYSVEDGYVSRVKISTVGYGNALYIDHPNGYTSVYAHLKRFDGNIARYIKQLQYSKQRFDLDEQIPPGVLYVNKGDVVAISGNTGSSTAPHLHFEIRETASEVPVNPLLCGYEVPDKRHPLINGLAVYNIDPATMIYEKPKVHSIKKLGKGMHELNSKILKVGTPSVALGLKAYDKLDEAENLNGFYSMELIDNGQTVFAFKMDEVGFHETRYLNSHCDYHYKNSGKGWMTKCFKDPGNNLTIYDHIHEKGVINIGDTLLHKIVFKVKDVKGNTSILSFMLQYDPSKPLKTPALGDNFSQLMRYNTDNYFEKDKINIFFPYGSFYNDLAFQYKEKADETGKLLSNVHRLQDQYTPVHKHFDIKIKPKRELTPEEYDKAIIILKRFNGSTKALKSKWDGNYLTARSKEFGSYYITTDTKAPIISPYNMSEGRNTSKNKTITIKVSDGLSGLESYNGYVDGNWVLMEHDPPYVRYWFDERVPPGKHLFEFDATDRCGNKKTYKANFTR